LEIEQFLAMLRFEICKHFDIEEQKKRVFVLDAGKNIINAKIARREGGETLISYRKEALGQGEAEKAHELVSDSKSMIKR
jgi:hypothetical protein